MCTVIILRRPDHPWPLLLAANRDEMEDRPWLPPARHWPDREGVTAGLDQLADGTWLGVNDRAMVAAVLNRPDSLGPQVGKRSRGELPLEALDHESAEAAVDALKHIDPAAYRPFNIVVADTQDAFWLAAREGERIVHVAPIPEGLSMITAHDLGDTEGSARIRHHLPLFEAAPPPNIETGDWTGWQERLGSREIESTPESAMCIETDWGFATRSSSLIALPRPQNPLRQPIWRFCHGAPTKDRWTDIEF